MDSTLRQLLAELYQCHREIEALRRRVAELEAAQQETDAPAPKPEREGLPA
jgi:prefoldin subunit 5